MDWTMVNNAGNAKERIQTLYYLLFIRYESDPYEAGKMLHAECRTNKLCISVMNELKSELTSGQEDLGMGKLFDDSMARTYLNKVFSTYEDNK